jgi:tRNA A37 methylthiotransferase MiaB
MLVCIVTFNTEEENQFSLDNIRKINFQLCYAYCFSKRHPLSSMHYSERQKENEERVVCARGGGKRDGGS